jgi:hypothetical protein
VIPLVGWRSAEKARKTVHTHWANPRLRPSSLTLAVVHVIVSFAGFALLPALLSVLLPLLPAHASQPYVVLVLLFSALMYLLLSWVWLIARILQDIGGNPRGGHPVSNKS